MSARGAVIALKAGGRRVPVAATSIAQVVAAGALVQVPLARPGLAGVLVHEGRAVPVYGLTELPLESARGDDAGELKQIAIIEHEGALAGILVESADAVEPGAEPPSTVLDGRAVLIAAGILERGGADDHAAETAKGES